MNPLDDLLRHRWARSIALFLGCATAIALGGGYLGIGPFHPLDRPVVRVLVIVALAAFWGGALWWSERDAVRRRRTADVRALRARFAGGMARLRERGSMDRPWYLVVGTPGSGKSAWLAGAGFERVIAPWKAVAAAESATWPSCEWWSDGHAVMLEAEGRLAGEEGAWHALLGLLRRRARKRLAGIVVAVAMPGTRPEHADGEARHLRARLDEVLDVSGRLPVYLVVTRADRIPGFGDWVALCDDGERAQPWGATFADLAHDDGRVAVRVSRQFEALAARLDAQLIARLGTVRDASSRARLLAFPQGVRWHAEPIASLVDTVFGARVHGYAPMLRGFYLVSSTQDGQTCDRLAASLEHHFGIRGPSRVPSRSTRRAYFGQRLVRDLMLPEAGLGTPRGATWRRWVLLGCLPAVTAGIAWAMLDRHARQARVMERVSRVLDEWPGERTVPTSLREYYALALRRLDVLARAASLAEPGWPDDAGLRASLREALRREVAEGVLPGLALQWRDAMQAREPRRVYLALKGHLMLALPARRDGDTLRRLARDHWREVFDDEGLVAALDRHVGDLLARGGEWSVFPMDRPLVDAARASLRAADIATLVYAGLTSGVNEADEVALRPDRALGLFADVFRRKSGEPLSTPLSPLHTRAAFTRLMGGEDGEGDIAVAAARFADEAWVLGEGPSASDRATLESRVRALYVADYVAGWENWLNDLAWAPDRAAVDAARLGGPASPLKALLLWLRDHTHGLAEGTHPSAREDALRIDAHFAPLTGLVEGEPGRAPLDRVLAALDATGRQLLATRAGAPAPARDALDALRMEATRVPAPLSTWIDGLAGSGQAVVRRREGDAIGAAWREAVGEDCALLVTDRYPFVAEGSKDVPLRDFAALFGKGGRMDAYVTNHLAAIVDTSRPAWRYRDGVAAGPAQALAAARASVAIRDAWFQGGAQPAVDFTLSIEDLPPGVGRVTIDIDGQVYERAVGKHAGAVRLRWPGTGTARTVVSAWDAEGHPLPVLDYPGEWGWFRALDAAHLERRTETRFEATFEPGGRAVRVEIEAASLRHPFADGAVHRFRCPP
ncbi:type VI secretion system membrane subunit TssM [Luteibacter aegosomatis]|uniref:type VI secretion system membrane subunit TssM n=1 Tax=Luteibacter aegosomatis TaxID=2911537 RepID=UPI001FF9C980|nr:type VI secretion system membrane subunit TssM [Luteibacter aegosomatis]UPG84768.1 type VI secretion system membrane subunit TssM [Luteibacter aegosomatis]